MQRRAALVDETRLRITEATVRLHTTIGPAATSIAGVAEEAGVTRLTVYRHFPDLASLFTACSRHWLAAHPGPDPRAWTATDDLEDRVRTGLGQLYAWYADVGTELFPIHRDIAAMPQPIQEGIRQSYARLVDGLVGGESGDDLTRRRQRAAASHVVSVVTWNSLRAGVDLDAADVLELAVRFVLAAGGD